MADDRPMTASTSTVVPSSCYSSMVASTSNNSLESSLVEDKFQYDLDFDLKALRKALKNSDFLDESGYQSVMARSEQSQYGTGWMVADSLSLGSEGSTDEWDGYMTVETERIKIKDLSDILASRYAFLSGARTRDGSPLLTFPDSRVQLSYPDYHRLVAYLLQVPPLEDSHQGYVIVLDRRLDKWSSVRMLLIHLSNYFPAPIRVVFVLKPEGVLQRALEVGYRTIVDSCQFKVVICQNCQELHHYIGRQCLTLDLGGSLNYSHLEWVQHRMDIERMKSSAAVIANSLSEFSRCLKDTELPNDVETTAHVLDTQRAEREAIKEDFRMAVRKGLSLLKSVRQAESKPKAEQLSPTRLHNVTSIERMLIQLDETERSFDAFWNRHEGRLLKCLELRRFEDEFRKLQANFARHMIYLEEHREIGDCPEKAEQLQVKHKEYMREAEEDVRSATELRVQGQQLISVQDPELEGSLLPKCDELARMADALSSSMQRRLQVLKLSQSMHEQISAANEWCTRGVELLSHQPYELSNKDEVHKCIDELDDFVHLSQGLDISALKQGPELHNLMVLTTTETSTLLQQVNARIEDVKKMCSSRRSVLDRVACKEKPVQAVSPEKHSSDFFQESSPSPEEKTMTIHRGSVELQTPEEVPEFFVEATESTGKMAFVIDELLNTENSYVQELESVLEYYYTAFDQPTNVDKSLASQLRDKKATVFGNLAEIFDFHRDVFLKRLRADAQQSQPAVAVAASFVENRDRFYLYNVYCQNKPSSDNTLQEIENCCDFLQECQKRAGHLLPLGAYLLKPVQRITKYQLLLKELNKCTQLSQVNSALEAMLELLDQLNASMNQANIAGYDGDLSSLGPVLSQSKFNIWCTKSERGSTLKLRRTNRVQHRRLFLFPKTLVICKPRAQSAPSSLPEYYQFKRQIALNAIGLTEHVKGNPHKFELWTEGRQEVFTLQAPDMRTRNEWISRLKHQMNAAVQSQSPAIGRSERPHSWAASSGMESCSNVSSTTDLSSLYTEASGERDMSPSDTNGNRDSCSLVSNSQPDLAVDGENNEHKSGSSLQSMEGTPPSELLVYQMLSGK